MLSTRPLISANFFSVVEATSFKEDFRPFELLFACYQKNQIPCNLYVYLHENELELKFHTEKRSFSNHGENFVELFSEYRSLQSSSSSSNIFCRRVLTADAFVLLCERTHWSTPVDCVSGASENDKKRKDIYSSQRNR